MIFYRILFVLCILVLLRTKVALGAALRAGDIRRARVLHLLRLGFGLSALSDLLHIVNVPANDLISLCALMSCFLGTLFLYMGWMEHCHLPRERPQTQAEARGRSGDEPDRAEGDEPGLPFLEEDTRRVLKYARAEARYRRQSWVDTDHMLLGLLREPSCAAGDILRRLGIVRANMFLALGHADTAEWRLSQASFLEMPCAEGMLTDRAREVFALAAQEARRFDRPAVGTEHLLLGMVLMGKGAAAAVLFQSGVTVENIRAEILKKRAAGAA